MHYGARYYDAALGRFLQPDSIVPDWYNPQSLNRYSYTLNNPVKSKDPSGHATCVDDDCTITVNAKHQLMAPRGIDVASESILEHLGGKNDLEAMALMADLFASYYRRWDRILPAMSQVFNGTSGYGPGSLLQAAIATSSGGGCAGMGRETHDCPANEGRPQFSDTGFHSDFRDGHNQAYHAWSNIAEAAAPGQWVDGLYGVAVGAVGNWVHEKIQSDVSRNVPGLGGLGWGTSWQDFVLSEKSMAIGLTISAGNMNPSELGDVMRSMLGPQGRGSGGRLQYYLTTYGPLAGSPP